MVCVPLAGIGKEELREALALYEGAELRLDSLALADDEVYGLVKGARAKVIATCRPCAKTEAERISAMVAAIKGGAAWADVEIEAEAPYLRAVAEAARDAGSTLVVSVHDWENTPSLPELGYLVDKCFELGAGVAKLSCMAKGPGDCARVLSLYGSGKPLVAFCMGPAGRITRLAAHFLGAPFTFASMGEGRGTAPGQIEYGAMMRLIEELGDGRDEAKP